MLFLLISFSMSFIHVVGGLPLFIGDGVSEQLLELVYLFIVASYFSILESDI